MSEEAPYDFVYTTVNVEGRKVRVYYLGGEGKRKLQSAISRDVFYRNMEKLIAKIQVLIDIIGEDKLVGHFKANMLKTLENSARRRSELIQEPFWFEKREALDSLLQENKVFQTKTGGWIKLKGAKE